MARELHTGGQLLSSFPPILIKHNKMSIQGPTTSAGFNFSQNILELPALSGIQSVLSHGIVVSVTFFLIVICQGSLLLSTLMKLRNIYLHGRGGRGGGGGGDR